MSFYVLLFGAIAWFFISGWGEATKAHKTGADKQANSTQRIRKKLKERMQIENKYGLLDKYDHDSQCYKELQAHREKWAEPGTKAYEEVEKKTAQWNAGKRW